VKIARLERRQTIADDLAKALNLEVVGLPAGREMAVKGFTQRPSVSGDDGRSGPESEQGTNDWNGQGRGFESHGGSGAGDEEVEHAAADRGDHRREFAFAAVPAMHLGETSEHFQLHSADGQAVGEEKGSQRRYSRQGAVLLDDATSLALTGRNVFNRNGIHAVVVVVNY